MKKDVDCQVFEDQLDALLEGALSEEGIGQLHHHARECPDCSMLLRVKEHLSLPSLEELESAVPEELLGSLLQRVEGELRATPSRSRRESLGRAPGRKPYPQGADRREPGGAPRRQSLRAWLIPTLAAASAVLLFSTGFLFSELRTVRATGSRLAEEVGVLRTEVVELGMRTYEVERTARLGGKSRYRAKALDFLLTGPEPPTVGDLIQFLEGLSEDRVLLEASQLRRLATPSTFLPREIREIAEILDRGIGNRGIPQDINAGELAKWLEDSGIPRDWALPTSRLIQLLS